MGRILSKFEQLFTPSFLQNTSSSSSSGGSTSHPTLGADHTSPIPLKTPPRSRRTSSTHSSSASLSSNDSSASFHCSEFMSRILLKIKSHKDAAAASSSPSSSSAAASAARGVNFPFTSLPEVCKMRVFSFLDTRTRGVAMKVCHEWNELLRTPSLWTDVDLTQIPRHADNNTVDGLRHHHRCDVERRDAYEQRVDSYLTLVSDIGPAVSRFKFAYDVYSCQTSHRFFQRITEFMRTTKGDDVRDASLVWDSFIDTTATIATADVFPNDLTPTTSLDGEDKRGRVRVFVQLLEQFVKFAPNVRRLTLPFDWSSRSVHILARLVRLETLTITSYYSYRVVDQALLSAALAQLTLLKNLTLEMRLASGAGLCAYAFKSDSLERLNVASCHGLVIAEVSLPRLRQIVVSRRPFFGPLASGRDAFAANQCFPCLLEVLRAGAPNLELLNSRRLGADWRVECDAPLELELKEVCACQVHYCAGL